MKREEVGEQEKDLETEYLSEIFMKDYWNEHRFLHKREIHLTFHEFMNLTDKHTTYLVITEHEAYLKELDDIKRAEDGKPPRNNNAPEIENSPEMENILDLD